MRAKARAVCKPLTRIIMRPACNGQPPIATPLQALQAVATRARPHSAESPYMGGPLFYNPLLLSALHTQRVSRLVTPTVSPCVMTLHWFAGASFGSTHRCRASCRHGASLHDACHGYPGIPRVSRPALPNGGERPGCAGVPSRPSRRPLSFLGQFSLCRGMLRSIGFLHRSDSRRKAIRRDAAPRPL